MMIYCALVLCDLWIRYCLLEPSSCAFVFGVESSLFCFSWSISFHGFDFHGQSLLNKVWIADQQSHTTVFFYRILTSIEAIPIMIPRFTNIYDFTCDCDNASDSQVNFAVRLQPVFAHHLFSVRVRRNFWNTFINYNRRSAAGNYNNYRHYNNYSAVVSYLWLVRVRFIWLHFDLIVYRCWLFIHYLPWHDRCGNLLNVCDLHKHPIYDTVM